MSELTELTGKVFVVTGAASGIGRALSTRLTAAGADVYSLDRNAPEHPVTGHFDVDLADEHSINAVIAALPDSIDGLANIAGVPGTLPPATVFAVNFLGLRHLTEGLLPKISQGSAVANVASTAGASWATRLEAHRLLMSEQSFSAGAAWYAEHAPAGVDAYGFSKEAVNFYTLSSSVRFAHHGVRMNAVMPGPVKTPLLTDFESTMGKDIIDGVRSLVGRHAEPDDIAAVLHFFLTEDSRWVNGQTIAVDGGLTGAVSTGSTNYAEIRSGS